MSAGTVNTGNDNITIAAETNANKGQNGSDRKRRKLIRAILSGSKHSPILWAVSPDSPIAKPVRTWHKSCWRNRSSAADDEGGEIAAAEGMDSLTRYETALLQIAATAYGAATGCEQQPRPTDNGLVAKGLLLSQLAQIEWPMWRLTLDPSSDISKVWSPCVKRMEMLVANSLDNDGWLLAAEFADLGLLAASWCRCQALCRAAGIDLDVEIQSQLDWLCLQLFRCQRFDGSIMLGPAGARLISRSFVSQMRAMIVDRDVRRMLKASLIEKSGSAAKRTAARVAWSGGSISEWAQVGVLRGHWRQRAAHVAFAFGKCEIFMEAGRRDTWFSGNCTPRLVIDGQELQPTSEIGVSCDLKFDEADFVELEIEYESFKLHRQILLLGADELLMICDNVVGPKAQNIQYECTYPLAGGIEFLSEQETTEVYLRSGKRHCLVLPLALPEWKAARSPDRLVCDDGKLTLRQTIAGRGISAPLIFDLNPSRSQKPRTWRRLTVGESMSAVPPDIAAAFRVQIGRNQWLIYRSLSEKGNRTFLGQNHAVEFFVGRIGLEGDVSAVVEVE